MFGKQRAHTGSKILCARGRISSRFASLVCGGQFYATDLHQNSKITDKIFIASAVGQDVAAAEDKIKATLEKALLKAGDFTTNKMVNPKGYTLRLKVTKYTASGNEASCTITGEILRYPAVTYSKSKLAGATQTEKVMFAGEWKGSATASGHGKYAALECIEAIVESMVPKSFPVMRSDMMRR